MAFSCLSLSLASHRHAPVAPLRGLEVPVKKTNDLYRIATEDRTWKSPFSTRKSALSSRYAVFDRPDIAFPITGTDLAALEE